MAENIVLPHGFEPLRWWDSFVPKGRCRVCYFPRSGHPIHNFWAIRRHRGDERRLSWGEAASLELDNAISGADEEPER